MPYEFNWKNRGCIITLTGTSSADEINEANGILQGDPRFDDHKYQIWNLLQADLAAIDTEEAIIPAAIDSVSARYVFGIKVALVVKEAHAVDFCREYMEESEVFHSTWVIQLFDNLEDAAKWAQC